MAGPTQTRAQSQPRAFPQNINAIGTISAIRGQRTTGHGPTLVGHGAAVAGHGATVATIVAGHGVMNVVVEFGQTMETAMMHRSLWLFLSDVHENRGVMMMKFAPSQSEFM